MKILIAGDFCPRGSIAELINADKYENVFTNIKQVTADSDYSIVNLECPVINGVSKPIEKIGPSLSCSYKSVNALAWMGFNCVTLANNHFRDYGDKGVKETLDALQDHNIDHVGGGLNIEEAEKILYKDIAGLRLAIINCCENEFSIAAKDSAGSNPLNPVKQYYAIQKARENADKVLIITHGGHEMFNLPSLRMVETYRFFIDAGADVVVNHHQHCYSGYEYYKGKPIFYGLGNFCFESFGKATKEWSEGYFVSLDFLSNSVFVELYPYKQCLDTACIEILQKDVFKTKLKELNHVISDPDALNSVIEKYYLNCGNSYSNLFEPIWNRFYLGAKRRGWIPSLISRKRILLAFDYVNCESHKDKLLFWLKANI